MFKQLVEIWYERWMTRKALRLLVKQEWSIDFLIALLVKASKVVSRPLEMEIKNKYGHSVIVKTANIDLNQTAYKDDSIFNHLDDELKVQQFIKEMSR